MYRYEGIKTHFIRLCSYERTMIKMCSNRANSIREYIKKIGEKIKHNEFQITLV